MKFCKECGAVLLPKKTKDKTILVCPKCKKEYTAKGKQKLSEKIKKEKEIEIIKEKENKEGVLTKTKCPKCGHNKAFYTTMQTRSSDEPPTRIYRCEECNHIWREYS
ncbi:MAG: transcription factor S [Candidatus Woesearchaeota archaeon]